MHPGNVGNDVRQPFMPNFSSRSLTNAHSFKWEEKPPDAIHGFIFCILKHVFKRSV